jgi:hypothetical protein
MNKFFDGKLWSCKRAYRYSQTYRNGHSLYNSHLLITVTFVLSLCILLSIGPFTWSKFAIKNNCNDSFVLRVCFICFLKLLFFVFCVFKAFSHSLILFRVKVGVKLWLGSANDVQLRHWRILQMMSHPLGHGFETMMEKGQDQIQSILCFHFSGP